MATNNTLKSLEYSAQNALRSLLVPLAIRSLARASARQGSIDEAVQLVEEFRCLHMQIAASQKRQEIIGLLKLIQSRPPKTVLEIGSYKGGTFFLFTRVAAPDATLISLDLPPIRRGLGYPAWRGRLMRSFGRANQQIELVQADSHEASTRDRIQQVLGGRSIEFLLIDGDHTYAGVKQDFQLYSPLVAKGGLIAFHDIAPGHRNPNCGVPQFWQEVKKGCKATEFVADWKQGGYGIGVLETA